MAGKLFIIYYDSPTSTDASGRVRPFTKSDVCWFGTDEHMALQQYRSYARGGGSNLVHIKSIDLDKLEEYTSVSPVDETISALNKALYSSLNRLHRSRLRSRGSSNRDGSSITYSFTLDEIEPAKPGFGGRSACKSLIHRNDIDCGHVIDDAYNSVFPILVDKYLNEIDSKLLLVPVKININGKTYRKLEPNK